MLEEVLIPVYRLFLIKGDRVQWIDQKLGIDRKISLSLDDVRNESEAYVTLFSEKNRQKVEQIYSALMNEMDGVSYDQCGGVLKGLAFLQEVASVALWKYSLNVGEKIEEFTREFDRLDVSCECVRLYESAQSN